MVDDNNSLDGSVTNIISAKEISSLTAQHLSNFLSHKDPVTNHTVAVDTRYYVKRFTQLWNQMSTPLTYVWDDVYDMYQYTKKHMKYVLEHPRSALIKEKQMILKSRLKYIEPSTFRWLAQRSGNTISEKLANTKRVLSTSKRYTFDIKENQVVKQFYYLMDKHIQRKNLLVENNPELFGTMNGHIQEIKAIETVFRKWRNVINANMNEVRNIVHNIPNNALIGNVNYASIWRAYRYLYRKQEIQGNSIDSESYLKLLYRVITIWLLSNRDFYHVEKSADIFGSDDVNYTFYRIELTNLYELQLSFTGTRITINRVVFSGGMFLQQTDITHTLIFEIQGIIDNSNNRGLLLSFSPISQVSDVVIDLVGLRDFLERLGGILLIKPEPINRDYKKNYVKNPLLSIISYDNQIYSDKKPLLHTVGVNPLQNSIIENDLYYLKNDIYHLSDLVSSEKQFEICLSIKERLGIEDEWLFYDVSDSVDEFDTSSLRNAMMTYFTKSFPVWRSILAVEAIATQKRVPINDIVSNNCMVLDLVGSNVVCSRVGAKNGRLIHYGSERHSVTDQINPERFYLLKYLEKYFEKYGIDSLSLEAKQMIVTSGKLSRLLENKSKDSYYFIVGDYNNHQYIKIAFDVELFKLIEDDYVEEIITNVDFIGREIPNLYIIIPNWVDAKKINNSLTNKLLTLGANSIRNYLNESSVCWYERLPRLDLEVIQNGQYDSIAIVSDQEEYKAVTNMIGRREIIHVSDQFTLPKGYPFYSLPLIKSFIGEKNLSYSASVEDKSFPLSDDVHVRLELQYQYGNVNSYDLSFVPTRAAPFDKLNVKWIKSTDLCNRDLAIHIANSQPTTEEISQAHNRLIGYFSKDSKDFVGTQLFYMSIPKTDWIDKPDSFISVDALLDKFIRYHLLNDNDSFPSIISFVSPRLRLELIGAKGDKKYALLKSIYNEDILFATSNLRTWYEKQYKNHKEKLKFEKFDKRMNNRLKAISYDLLKLHKYDRKRFDEIVMMADQNKIINQFDDLCELKHIVASTDYYVRYLRHGIDRIRLILTSNRQMLFNQEDFSKRYCIGIYIALEKLHQDEYIKLSQILRDAIDNNDFPNNSQAEETAEGLAMATLINIDIFDELSKTDYGFNFSYTFFDFVTKAINKLKLTNNVHILKRTIFLSRFLLELLLSLIKLRTQAAFSDLLPGKTISTELIRSLKSFNRDFNNFQNTTTDDKIKRAIQNFKTSLTISMQKPVTLYNVRNEVYCLIVFLSGDESANHIKIVRASDDDNIGE